MRLSASRPSFGERAADNQLERVIDHNREENQAQTRMIGED